MIFRSFTAAQIASRSKSCIKVDHDHLRCCCNISFGGFEGVASLKLSPPAAAESCGGGQLSLCVAPLQQEGKPKNLDHLGDHHLNTVTVDGMDRCGIICCSLQGNEALSSSSVDTGYLSRGELSPGSPSCSSGWTRKRIIIMKWGGC